MKLNCFAENKNWARRGSNLVRLPLMQGCSYILLRSVSNTTPKTVKRIITVLALLTVHPSHENEACWQTRILVDFVTQTVDVHFPQPFAKKESFSFSVFRPLSFLCFACFCKLWFARRIPLQSTYVTTKRVGYYYVVVSTRIHVFSAFNFGWGWPTHPGYRCTLSLNRRYRCTLSETVLGFVERLRKKKVSGLVYFDPFPFIDVLVFVDSDFLGEYHSKAKMAPRNPLAIIVWLWGHKCAFSQH